MTLALVLPAVVFLASVLLAPFAVRTCARRGLIAAGERHIHTTPTPHGGGFLFPLLVTPAGLLAVWSLHLPFAAFLTVLLLAGLPLAWVGWVDDHAHVPPRIRLAVHLGAVAIGSMFLPQLFDFMPLWAEKALLILSWGWFVNLFNFMDGADGLATSEAIVISIGISLLVPAFAPLAVLIAAVGLGFLRVNAPPAKVFMGDVSSTWLGYTLGGLLLVACADDTWTVIWPLITITLVFCGDATSTLIRRVLTGHKPWEPHKTFWFHRFLSLGYSHRQLLVAVTILNVALLLLALGSMVLGYPELGFFIGLLFITAVALAIRRG
ncbi:MAG: hypothetical protein GC129_01450 [Proteobacteria bacterium]|nr:hypothetical protein [Pseudomonadota bacterium]